MGASVGAALLAGVAGLGTGALATYAVMSDDEPVVAADARPAAEVLPERLPVLSAWVQERMGVRFLQDPRVEVLDDEAFERAYLADSTSAVPRSLPQDDYGSTAHALGLVEDLSQYDDYYRQTYADGVLGFYDPGNGRLAVRGTDWTPTVELTVVHELVHALQDQTVDLDPLVAATRVEDESHLGLTAVIEGQATVVEEDWLAEQSASFQDRYFAEGEEAALAADAPYDPFADVMSFLPYDLGWLAVVDLEDAAGPAETLDVLRSPPASTEQLYDLSAWRDGVDAFADPVAVPEPAVPDGVEVLDRGVLGVYVLGLLPDDPDDWVTADQQEPLQGWAGDRYVTWELDGRTCTRVDVDLDDPDAAAGLVEHLQDWRDGADGRAVRADGASVGLDACVDAP